MADLLGEELTFADLNIPLAMPAVDIITGRKVVLQGGRVIDAVRATISIPGIFEPAELADFRLVDGGVLDNVPVDVAHELGATRTIAVDVLPDYTVNAPGKPLVELGLTLPFAPPRLSETYQVLMIMISTLTKSKLVIYPPDVLIRPEIDSGVTLLNGFHRATEIIAAGEEATVAVMPEIHALLS
jgi:NTE family protein